MISSRSHFLSLMRRLKHFKVLQNHLKELGNHARCPFVGHDTCLILWTSLSPGTYSRPGNRLDVLSLWISDEVMEEDDVRLQAHHLTSGWQQQQPRVVVSEIVTVESGVFKMHWLLGETGIWSPLTASKHFFRSQFVSTYAPSPTLCGLQCLSSNEIFSAPQSVGTFLVVGRALSDPSESFNFFLATF